MSDSGARSPVTIGLDLGTSAVKAVAADTHGTIVGEGIGSFSTDSRLPQQAEQQPRDWLQATSTAMTVLGRQMQAHHGTHWTEDVAAVGLTGQLPTLVCMGDSGALDAAITWKDGRADTWASARVDTARRALMYATTGMPIDGRYLAPMLRFHFGDRLGEVRRILSAKDYLLAALTGLHLTEPSTAAGYGIYNLHSRRFDEDLARFWQLPMSLLPEIRGANTLAGPLTAEGASLLGLHPGVAISTGAADSVCASFAMAGLDERVASVSFGSSAVVIGCSSMPRLDGAARYLLTPHVNDEWYGREMDLLATGTGYRWLSQLFGWTDDELDRHAAESVPGAHGLCFPPYLAGGEQGALWNPRLRAGLFGLGLQHSRADIARAFLEGVFFEIRRCIDVLAETARVDSVMISGNVVHSPKSMQILADILNRPVGGVAEKSPAALGAALLARSLADGPSTVAPRGVAPSTARPQEQGARIYARLYNEYLTRARLCE